MRFVPAATAVLCFALACASPVANKEIELDVGVEIDTANAPALVIGAGDPASASCCRSYDPDWGRWVYRMPKRSGCKSSFDAYSGPECAAVCCVRARDSGSPRPEDYAVELLGNCHCLGGPYACLDEADAGKCEAPAPD